MKNKLKLKLRTHGSKLFIAYMAAYIQFLTLSPAHADALESALSSLLTWMTYIGASVVGIGFAIVGFKMTQGDEDAWHTGKKVIIGGIVIFLARQLVSILRGFSGQ